LINELRIAEMGVPVEVVVNGVINPTAAFATESHVQRGHAGVIEEGRVVGTITQRSQPQVGTIAQLLAVLRAGGASYPPKIGAFPHGNVLLRILNLTLDLVDRALQRVRAGDAQVAACAGIGVQIHHSVLRSEEHTSELQSLTNLVC